MRAAKIIVLVGLPGSGKSTWARAQRHTVLSSDQIRELLSDNVANQSIHARVFSAMRYLLKQRLEVGSGPTIVDATNLERSWRRPWLALARRYGAVAEAVFFDTDVETCLKQNRGRLRQVPEEAIRAMAAKLQRPAKEEGFRRIRVIRPAGTSRAWRGAKG